jgi:hypothetical protein
VRDLFRKPTILREGEIIAKLRWNSDNVPENIQWICFHLFNIYLEALDQVILQVKIDINSVWVEQGLFFACKSFGGVLFLWLFHSIFDLFGNVL